MKSISSCLWFDQQAEAAVNFYRETFKDVKVGQSVRYGGASSAVSGQKEGSLMTIEFQIGRQKFLALNGGPIFKFTQALSNFVWCQSEKEIDQIWQSLSAGGVVHFALQAYPWSKKYGWVADKFGVEWQLMLAEEPQNMAPALLFVDSLFGKGEQAINFYMSLFPDSKIEFMARDEKSKSITHCVFTLGGKKMVLMEGPGKPAQSFTPAYSLIVGCDTQAEIDEMWTRLSADPKAEQCGWLKDKFGVSWQIVPSQLGSLLEGDSEKVNRVMAKIVKMKKIDLKTLLES